MIAVCELYGPVYQGEGKTAKMSCMFLRLSGCNLRCNFCDSPATWNFIGTPWIHPDKYDPKLEVHKMEWPDVFNQLMYKGSSVKALVISGGEPMLQQNRLIPLLRALKTNSWHIEIETNGTIAPTEEFASLIDQFNCSPKTANSGPDNPTRERLIPSALQSIAGLGDKATFKFVIQSQEDLPEVMNIITIGRIQRKQVWLMPEGRTTEEQIQRQEEVKQMCKILNYNFSPRLHVLEFGNKRGV